MAKLCPRGKAAAKRKFKVYPSAYANMYASGVCSGKITPGGKKRKEKNGWWYDQTYVWFWWFCCKRMWQSHV